MLFPINELLSGKDQLASVRQDQTLKEALAMMVEGDYSQLPIVDASGGLVGLITEQSILSTYFHSSGAVSILDLPVDHCQTKARTLPGDRDIFEALDMLEHVYAIIIVDGKKPTGIFTAYDATHFFRDLSEGLILVEDIETTLRRYIEWLFPDDKTRDAALVRAFRQDKRDPNRPAKEYDELSFGDHVQLIVTEDNWERFQPYLQPKQMFFELMDEVREIRNKLAHFRGSVEPIEYDALVRGRDWLGSRPKPFAAGAKEVRKGEVAPRKGVVGDGDYSGLQRWLDEQKEAGVTSLKVSMQDVGNLIGMDLPESAYQHSSWWDNDYVNRVQARAWLSAGWRVDDADIEAEQVVLRQSAHAVYATFFARMLEALKQKRPGLTQATKVLLQNWMPLSAGRSGFAYSWVLPREGAAGGTLRVELDIQTDDKARNKQAFDALKSQDQDIQGRMECPLSWERLDNNKMSRVTASTPLRLLSAPPREIEQAQIWGVDTMLKFMDVFTPYLKSL